MDNSNYCVTCNATLTLHADGSIACSCDFLDAESAAIPDTWKLSLDELADARAVALDD